MSYLADKRQDLAAFLAEGVRHPAALVQNLLGLLTSLFSGGKRGEGRDGWVFYERARGLGPLLPRLFGQRAITIGNVTFCNGPLEAGRSLYWHEYVHHLQSVEHGLFWLPKYLSAALKGKYKDNPFEREAIERARALVTLYRGEPEDRV